MRNQRVAIGWQNVQLDLCELLLQSHLSDFTEKDREEFQIEVLNEILKNNQKWN